MRYLTFNNLRAKLGGRGRSTIYRDIQEGRLPKPIVLGGRNYWPEDEIAAALQRLADLRVPSSAGAAAACAARKVTDDLDNAHQPLAEALERLTR